MPQGEQVDAYMDAELGLQGCDGRGLDQAVHAEPAEEAHVVRDENVIEARAAHACQQLASPLERPGEHAVVGQGPDARPSQFLPSAGPKLHAV